ncbi:hypothetical protein BJ508DRAFT_341341 [Ascobolus immersus RN42]|uniref:MYND-type domain-containing protein n=1 Tax=Ascobolus immersus RN42 TaxID=1160509 RepID=A0A3N4IHU3_ASCIM|nr:hypothetical protein BJ508DRAFT_341341 [Ascobolus immersus RN42]
MPFERHPHPSGLRPWVKFHPEDDISTINPAYLGNPETFIPTVNPKTKRIEQWGIPIDSRTIPGQSSYIGMHRLQTTQYTYRFDMLPEEQFVRMLGAIKEAKLRAVEASPAFELRRTWDYVLNITYLDLVNAKGENFVHRTVKVPGNLELGRFVDQVLLPVMGWRSDYCSYILTDRKDGTLFGPEGASYFDQQHLMARGYYYIPDNKYTLAHLLTGKKSALGFIYHLGFLHRHEITIEEILTPRINPCANGSIDLISGSGDTVPMEVAGSEWQKLYELSLRDPRSMKVLETVFSAPNFSDAEMRGPVYDRGYNPHTFHEDRIRARLEKALKGKPTTYEGGIPKRQVAPVHYELVADGGQANPVPDPVERKCHQCGKILENIKHCPKCKVAYYCNRECQTKHWQKHKKACAAAVKEGR